MSVRILLVEDEAAIADFIIRGLKEEGFHVNHATNGTEAWEMMMTNDWGPGWLVLKTGRYFRTDPTSINKKNVLPDDPKSTLLSFKECSTSSINRLSYRPEVLSGSGNRRGSGSK